MKIKTKWENFRTCCRLESVCEVTAHKHQITKSYKWNGGNVPRILTSALNSGEWLASRLDNFTLELKPTGTVDWVSPKVSLKVQAKKKCHPCRESNPVYSY